MGILYDKAPSYVWQMPDVQHVSNKAVANGRRVQNVRSRDSDAMLQKRRQNRKLKKNVLMPMLEKQKRIADPNKTVDSVAMPQNRWRKRKENCTPKLPLEKTFHGVRASSLFLAPPPLQKTALAARRASRAGWVAVGLVVSPLPVTLPARSGTRGADTALDRARGRAHRRTVIVRVGVGGARAGCEEWVRGRTGVTPWPGAGGVLVRAWVFGSTGAGGVVADAVLQVGARGAGTKEVGRAAGGGAVGGTDDGEGVAEDVADVEVAGRVRFEYRAVGVGVAVGAHVGYADLAVETGSEVCAAGCGTGVGAAVEGEVGVLGVAGPGDGETVGLSVACSVGDCEDAEGCCEEGQ